MVGRAFFGFLSVFTSPVFGACSVVGAGVAAGGCGFDGLLLLRGLLLGLLALALLLLAQLGGLKLGELLLASRFFFP